MKYTVLLNSAGVVVNTLETNSGNELFAADGQNIVEVSKADYNIGLIGYTYDNGAFVAPVAPPEPTPEPTPEPVLPKHISVGRFFDRFGNQKYPILASADPMVQALIKDCSVRSYIDLDDPQLPYGLGMLVSSGFTIDVEAILNTPLTDIERA